MFTGIIQSIGTITEIERQGDWLVTINAKMALDDVKLGASIACSGMCLTVTEVAGEQFKVQVSAESLSKTTAAFWNIGTRVNLERSLRAGEELGGHLVSGHVDGTARVIDKKREGDSFRYMFEVPPSFARFMAPKGSVAIDGISLTVNEVEGERFGVNIIPHTRLVTTIGDRQPGDMVNFEVDLIARYLDRLMAERTASRQ